MGRVLYIVAREQPLLYGYLMTTVGARSPDGHSAEIKLDERRGERRLQREARDPERRRGARRRQPSYDSDLRSRGYATVVQSEATPSQSEQPTREPVMVWRPRSTWWHRAARARRRPMRRSGGRTRIEYPGPPASEVPATVHLLLRARRLCEEELIAGLQHGSVQCPLRSALLAFED
jgi:hypothetical protein